MGIAGLWASWRAPDGELVYSYTMLTINADEHALMRNFHKPADEKRMVVILPESRYEDWLNSVVDESRDFMKQFAAEQLRAEGPQVAAQLF